MSVRLETQLQYLKGVGPKLGELLRKKGLSTVGDLLEYYPRSYEDRRAARDLKSLKAGENVSLIVEVVGVKSHKMGRSNRRAYSVLVRDESGFINCKYFRVPFRGYFEQFEPGSMVQLTGKVIEYRGQIEFHHPEIVSVQEKEIQVEDRIVPIYPETEGLTSKKIRKLVESAFLNLGIDQTKAGEIPELADPLPEWIRTKYDLPDRSLTLAKIHFPEGSESETYLKLKSPFHRRVIFEEFFWLELLLAARRSQVHHEKGFKMEERLSLAQRLKDSLGFTLTGDQEKCFSDVLRDFKSGRPMHRLVQGDVGSGKTVIAFLASLVAIENGFQVAFMVPTEILAEQHYKTATKLLAPLGIQVGLLKGSMKESERRVEIEALKSQGVDLVLGTHALIQEGVGFQNLGLVIIDEQHRFGVHQRLSLKQKGVSPHLLLMTATPIPRSLAMTVYGDLDVSTVREKPAGRQEIVSRVTFDGKRPQVYDFMKKKLQEGRQAYIIFPLVEESEKLELRNAVAEFENLKEEFKGFKVGLVHGKMKSQEKDQVMSDFYQNKIQILVSTTVVEVGVDVPNATIILIEHSERFGLSQLHQLRGRVGRGRHKSYCILMMGKAFGRESLDRVRVLEATSDGFEVSERDLEIRGPGEFLGERQSGLPGFKMADLIRDRRLLEEARRAAFELVEQDPHLNRKEHKLLRSKLLESTRGLAAQWIG